jgi:hypothetical protein
MPIKDTAQNPRAFLNSALDGSDYNGFNPQKNFITLLG